MVAYLCRYPTASSLAVHTRSLLWSHRRAAGCCDGAARCAAVACAWCAPTAAGAAAANLTDVSSTDVSATVCRYSSVVCAARSACVWEGRADDGATLALFVTQLDATWSLLTLVVVCRQGQPPAAGARVTRTLVRLYAQLECSEKYVLVLSSDGTGIALNVLSRGPADPACTWLSLRPVRWERRRWSVVSPSVAAVDNDDCIAWGGEAPWLIDTLTHSTGVFQFLLCRRWMRWRIC